MTLYDKVKVKKQSSPLWFFCTVAVFALLLVFYVVLMAPPFLTDDELVNKAVDYPLCDKEKVCLNHAPAAQLDILKGIGEVRANAIVHYREQNGEFQSIEELMLVEGITEKIFTEIKYEITVC